jgi:hypothetical protein
MFIVGNMCRFRFLVPRGYMIRHFGLDFNVFVVDHVCRLRVSVPKG